jgi:uncharacterized membrane protein
MKPFSFRDIARTLLNYFLRGLLFILPIAACFYVFISLFNTIDSLLPFFKDNPKTPDVNEAIPGAVFAIVITFTILVGYLGNKIFGQTILSFIDAVLERTPGVKYIYNLIKDFMEAFVGDKRKFTEPVMIEISEGINKLGFVTQRDMHQFGLLEYVGVYCPKSYGMMGDLLIVKKEKVKRLDKNATKTMSFIVSGGVTDIE